MFFKKQEKPFIKFRYREDHELIDRPTKAGKNLPQWLKVLGRVPKGEHKNSGGTIKRCIPAIDACTNGYIIPSWCDWYIKIDEETVEVENSDGEKSEETRPRIMMQSSGTLNMPQTINGHSWDQVGDDCPIKNYPYGKDLFKFVNPWVIETAKGWSCMFKSPANHYSNIRIIEGIVDTDTYNRQVNFPFFWDGCEHGEFEISKGDPLVQVIPFKRENLELQFDTWDHMRMSQMDAVHETHFFDRYRRLWWHKAAAYKEDVKN